MLPELGRGFHASSRAHRQRLCALIDAPTRYVAVLCLKGPRHVVHGEVLGAEPVGIEHDVDLPPAATEHEDLSNAVGALELAPQHLVGVFGDVAHRRVGRQRDRQNGESIRIALLDGRLRDRPWKQRQDTVDPIADLLRGDVGVLLQPKGHHDL